MQGSNLRPSAPKADALPGCANVRLFYSTICMFTSQAIWWDHLDLNQESTNYEFAALTNYAIVPIIHLQIHQAIYGAHHHASDCACICACTMSRDFQDDTQSIQHCSV